MSVVKFPHLFEPLIIKNTVFKNRIFASPQGSSYLDVDQLPTPEITVYSDTTGKPYESDIASTLKKQIINPVRWEAIVKDMIASGVDTFIEVGPGKTLTGLLKRMDDSVRALRMSEYGDLEEIKGALGC